MARWWRICSRKSHLWGNSQLNTAYWSWRR